ncbi:siderophore-interacting protein [Pseudoroseicyclus sp. H15]
MPAVTQLESATFVTIEDTAAFRNYLATRAAEDDFGLSQPAPGQLQAERQTGRAKIDLGGGAARIAVEAGDIGGLVATRGLVSWYLGGYDLVLAEPVWSGEDLSGQVPPNFHFADVVDVRELNRSYLRLTLEGDMAPFAAGGLHFRMFRQQPGIAAPVWPRMSARGTVDWPKGPGAPFCPAYTARHVYADAGVMMVDIFRHEGGPTVDWCLSRPIGERVGLSFSGKDDTPVEPWLMMAGDETAVPALLRMLEQARPDQRGEVLLLAGDESAVQEVQTASQIEARWLIRGKGESLTEAAAGLRGPKGETHYWFAASKAEARQMRAHFRQTLGVAREHMYCAAYW